MTPDEETRISTAEEDLERRAQQEKKEKRRRIVALAIAILALLTMLLMVAITQCTGIQRGGEFYDQSAEAIQEAVDREVKDGYFNMCINTGIPVYAADDTALAGIKNIEANHFDCIVTITLDDGTQVYKSGGLAPGTELKLITLDTHLEKGQYSGTALFEVYERNDAHTKVGQTASVVTLYVQ